jgi:DNA-binding transcriptional ArsR family regulator
MTTTSAPLDRVLHALADPTRRQVIERLSRSPASVSELKAPFAMSLPSFVQHLGVLEECGLVRSTKIGRVRTFRIVPKKLQVVEQWLDKQRSIWEKRLDQLDSYLIALQEKPS